MEYTKENADYTEPCTCGHKPCGGVKEWFVDPFEEEIHDRIVMVFGCGEDHQRLAWEI